MRRSFQSAGVTTCINSTGSGSHRSNRSSGPEDTVADYERYARCAKSSVVGNNQCPNLISLGLKAYYFTMSSCLTLPSNKASCFSRDMRVEYQYDFVSFELRNPHCCPAKDVHFTLTNQLFSGSFGDFHSVKPMRRQHGEIPIFF